MLSFSNNGSPFFPSFECSSSSLDSFDSAVVVWTSDIEVVYGATVTNTLFLGFSLPNPFLTTYYLSSFLEMFLS